jgi:predicted nuclease of restriction endonuclease-like (RecB) superfamily
MLDPLTGYPALLKEIKDRIRSAQYEALKSVNKEMISLYWDIGKMIIEKQKGSSWGKSVVERLSDDLQAEFPGINGFSSSNLWRMKTFYETYGNSEKLAPLVREINWTHNIIIIHTSSVKHGSPPVDDDALHAGQGPGVHKSTPVW